MIEEAASRNGVPFFIADVISTQYGKHEAKSEFGFRSAVSAVIVGDALESRYLSRPAHVSLHDLSTEGAEPQLPLSLR